MGRLSTPVVFFEATPALFHTLCMMLPPPLLICTPPPDKASGWHGPNIPGKRRVQQPAFAGVSFPLKKLAHQFTVRDLLGSVKFDVLVRFGFEFSLRKRGE